ncbi:MAG: hypothetical protein Q8Q85_04600 [Gemmatimonadales bacterium]|nr:hypothetical protein [Gemmatimonadales bacterium]
MPVTAKLSKKFYETLGDEIANELVEWFNQVDVAYHTGIREQFDTNFARFDAKLEQRVSGLSGSMDLRFARSDAALDRLRQEMDAGFAASEAASRQVRRETDAGFGQLRQEMDFLRSELRGEFKSGLAETRAELLKWMFIYWVGSAATTVGLILTVISVLRS